MDIQSYSSEQGFKYDVVSAWLFWVKGFFYPFFEPLVHFSTSNNICFYWQTRASIFLIISFLQFIFFLPFLPFFFVIFNDQGFLITLAIESVNHFEIKAFKMFSEVVLYLKLIICKIWKPAESVDDKFPFVAEIFYSILIDFSIFGKFNNNGKENFHINFSRGVVWKKSPVRRPRS